MVQNKNLCISCEQKIFTWANGSLAVTVETHAFLKWLKPESLGNVKVSPTAAAFQPFAGTVRHVIVVVA